MEEVKDPPKRSADELFGNGASAPARKASPSSGGRSADELFATEPPGKSVAPPPQAPVEGGGGALPISSDEQQAPSQPPIAREDLLGDNGIQQPDATAVAPRPRVEKPTIGARAVASVQEQTSKPPLFSAPSPEQGGEFPQLDPRWEKMVVDYRAKGGAVPGPTSSEADRASFMEGVIEGQLSELNARRDVLASAVHEANLTGATPEDQAMYQAEQHELDAMAAYLSRKLTQADIHKWKDPDVQHRTKVRLAADERWKRSQQLMAQGQMTHPEVIREQIVAPVSRAILSVGGNTGAVLARAAASGAPQGTGAQVALDEAAGWFSEGLRDLEARRPTETTKGLSPQNVLPKFAEAATYMGFLAASAPSGAPGMIATGMLASGDDYYREAIDAGMKPDQAEAFSLVMSGTESAVELVNPGPFFNSGVRKQLAKKALKSMASGEAVEGSARAVIGKYMAEQAGAEGAEEAVTYVAQNAVSRGANAITGAELNTEISGAEMAESAFLGAALGGLLGGIGKLSQRPVYKEGVRWAVENEPQFMEYLNAKVPEAERAPILERYEKYKSIYKGIPPTVPKEAATTIAAAVAEKERIKEEQSKTTIDETVAAAMGNQFEDQLKAEDEIIAGALGIDLVELARANEAKRLAEQYDKQKLKSEITKTPMPEGAVRPEVPTITPKVEAAETVTEQPTVVEDVSTVTNDAASAPTTAIEPSDVGTSVEEVTEAPPPVPSEAPPSVPAPAAEAASNFYIKPDLSRDVSDDPVALASAYIDEHIANNDDSTLDDRIGTLVGNNISADSFKMFGDVNKITKDMKRAYLRENGGRTLDDLAQELSSEGEEVSPQDIVEYVLRNPAGKSATTPRSREIAERYYGITGKRMNSLVVKSILKGKKVKWTPEEQAIVDEAQAAGVDLSEINDDDVNEFKEMSDEDADLFFGSRDTKKTISQRKLEADANAKAAEQVQPAGAAKAPGEVRGAESTRPAQDPEREILEENVAGARKELETYERYFKKQAESLFDKDAVQSTRRGVTKAAEPGLFEAEGDTRANSAEDMEVGAKTLRDRVTLAEKALADYDAQGGAREKASAKQTSIDQAPVVTQAEAAKTVTTAEAKEVLKGSVIEGRMDTYAKAVAANLKHMGTPGADWMAVPFTGEVVEGPGGKKMFTQDYTVTKGMAQGPTLFPSPADPANCEWCGHQPIKTVYGIYNPKAGYTLRVGSECIGHFQDGATGDRMGRDAAFAANVTKWQGMVNAARELSSVFKFTEKGAYGRQETSWKSVEAEKINEAVKKLMGSLDPQNSGAAAFTKWAAKNSDEALDLTQRATSLLNTLEAKKWRLERQKRYISAAEAEIREATRNGAGPDSWRIKDANKVIEKAKAKIAEIEAPAQAEAPLPKKEEKAPASFKRPDPKPVTKPTVLRDVPSSVETKEYAIQGFEEYPVVAFKDKGGWKAVLRVGGLDMEIASGQPTHGIAATVAHEKMSRAGKEKLDGIVESLLNKTEDGPMEMRPTSLPPTITIDGKERSTTNSKGQPIATTEEGVRNFWNWFGDSRVLDGEGRPLVVYHGTPEGGFDTFDQQKIGSVTDSGWIGRGFYFSDEKSTATMYAFNRTGPKKEVYEVYVKMDNPFMWGQKGYGVVGFIKNNEPLPGGMEDLIFEKTGFRQESYERWRMDGRGGMSKGEMDRLEAQISKIVTEELSKRGHDGVIANFGKLGGGEYVVFNNTQIKSATGNSGAFDPANPNITQQRPTDRAPKTGKPNTDKAMKALQGIAPGFKVIAPSNKADYQKAIENFPDAVKSSWGLYDQASNTAYINPEGLDARNTLFHESGHPLIAALRQNQPEKFKAFYDSIEDQYKKYAKEKYSDKSESTQQDEALTQFLADVADGTIPVSTKPDSLWQKFKAFIQDLLASLGWDMRSIDMSQPDNVRAFAAQFKNAMDKGIKMTGLTMADGTQTMQQRPKTTKASEWNAAVDDAVKNAFVKDQAQAIQDAANLITDPAGKDEFIKVMSEQWGITTPPMGTKANQKKVSRVFLRDEILKAAEAGKRAGIADVAKARKAFVEQVKEALSKDNLKSKLTAAQARVIATRAARMNPLNPKAIERFIAYVEKVAADAAYAEAVEQARDISKRIKRLVRGKADERRDAMVNDLAGEFAKLNIANVDIAEYLDKAKRLLDTLSSPKAKSAPDVVTAKNTEVNIDNAELESYVKQQEAVDRAAAERDAIEEYEALRDELGAENADLTPDELKVIIDAMTGVKEQAEAAERLTQMREKVKMLRTMARLKMEELARYRKSREREEDITFSPEQTKMLDDLKDIDVDRLTGDEAAFLITAANNIIVNDRWGGVRDFAAKGRAERGIKDATKALAPLKRIGRPGDEEKDFPIFNKTDTNEMLAEKIARGPTAAAKFMQAIGMHDWLASISSAKRELDSVVRSRNEAAKKLGFKQHVDDSVLNRYKMGFYAYLIQHKGGSKEDMQAQFDKRAENVRESVRRMENPNKFEQFNRNAALYIQAANDVLGDAKSIEELNISPKLRGMVEHQIGEYQLGRENTFNAAEYDHNKIPDAYSNYTRQRSMAVTDEAKADEQKDLFEAPMWGNRLIDSRPSSSKMDRSDMLLPGHAINADFFSVQDQSLFETVADNLGAQHLATLREVLNDPRTMEMLGASTRNLLRDRVRSIKGLEVTKGDLLTGITGSWYHNIAKRSMGIALKGVMQMPKQATVAISTYVGLGKDANLMWQSYADASKAFTDQEGSWQYQLVKDEQIHERAKTLGGLEKLGDSIAKKAVIRGDEGDAARVLKVLAHDWGVAVDKLLVPLSASDAISAQAAWFAFYKKKLKQKGVDLRTEGRKHEKDAEAAAYANQMTSRQQNANAVESMAQIYREKGSGRVIVDLMFSYSSFALNTKKRMARDIQTLRTGAKEDKAYAARDLAGMTLETMAFSAMTYWIAMLGKELADKIVDAAFGGDGDDDDLSTEEWLTDVLSKGAFELLFGGLPEVAANTIKTGINPAAEEAAKLFGTKVRESGKDLFYVPYGWGAGSGRYGAVIDELTHTAKGWGNIDRPEGVTLGMLSLFSILGLSDQTFTRPMERELYKRLNQKKKKSHRGGGYRR